MQRAALERGLLFCSQLSSERRPDGVGSGYNGGNAELRFLG
jgi:hypothetical protein